MAAPPEKHPDTSPGVDPPRTASYSDEEGWFKEWDQDDVTDVRSFAPVADLKPRRSFEVVFPHAKRTVDEDEDTDPGVHDEHRPTLVHVEFDGTEQPWPLEGEVVRIGRGPDNEVQIRTDGQVSRHHARLVRQGPTWYVEDAGATNGILVNGERVRGNRRLYGGETLMLGQSMFRFRFR